MPPSVLLKALISHWCISSPGGHGKATLPASAYTKVPQPMTPRSPRAGPIKQKLCIRNARHTT